MPTVLRADPKEQISVEYHRIQLTQYFLDWSLKYVGIAKKEYEVSFENEIEASVTSIIHSALFVESFINQFAEEFIKNDDRLNFDRCKKSYKNTSDLSNTVWKLYCILNKQTEDSISLDDNLLIRINDIIQIRHKLVHYKPEESSRKIYRKAPNSNGMFTLDFMGDPVKIEPSLLEKEVCCLNAIAHYMSCRELLLLWCNLIGQDVGGFSRYPKVEIFHKKIEDDSVVRDSI